LHPDNPGCSGCVAKWSGISSSGGEEGIESLDDIKVYPNPVKENLTVEFGTEVTNGTISIFNIHGKMVKYLEVGQSSGITLDVVDLPAGTYLLKMNSDQANTKRTFLVQ